MAIRDIWFRLSANPRCIGSLDRLMGVTLSPTRKFAAIDKHPHFDSLTIYNFRSRWNPTRPTQDRRYLLGRNSITPNGALLFHQQESSPPRDTHPNFVSLTIYNFRARWNPARPRKPGGIFWGGSLSRLMGRFPFRNRKVHPMMYSLTTHSFRQWVCLPRQTRCLLG